MTKHRKPDDEPAAKPKQIEPAWSEDDSGGDARKPWPKERAAAPAEPEAPKRTIADVLADMDTAIAGMTRLSPSGVETAASQLAALVGELRGMVK